jgi:hypothetical protein
MKSSVRLLVRLRLRLRLQRALRLHRLQDLKRQSHAW